MTTNVTPSESRDTEVWREFDRSTSRWGRITMLIALVCAFAGPLWLVFFSGVNPDLSRLGLAFAAVAAVVGVVWVIEPIAYYPILGPAAMYQAFVIGNISNKLLPSAVTAQARIRATAGTKRADLAAILAICGAAVVHIVSLIIFVGVLGTWLVEIVPQALLDTVAAYILPSVLGAFVVQIIVTNRHLPRVLIAAAVISVAAVGLVAMMPAFALYATVTAVVLSATVAWITRKRPQTDVTEDATAREEKV